MNSQIICEMGEPPAGAQGPEAGSALGPWPPRPRPDEPLTSIYIFKEYDTVIIISDRSSQKSNHRSVHANNISSAEIDSKASPPHQHSEIITLRHA